jgi:hypothetical protein
MQGIKMNLIEWIFIIGLAALLLFALLGNLRKRQMMNAPTCGHSGVKRWVPEERAWLCDECYQEWLIDHARNIT